MVVLNNYGY